MRLLLPKKPVVLTNTGRMLKLKTIMQKQLRYGTIFRTSAMKVRLKLKPGQKGAKKLTARYGDKLVCVRYRYDEKRHKRFTTVELIVDELLWLPTVKKDPVVYLKAKRTEVKIHDMIKSAGGTWDRSKFLWVLPFSQTRKLGLEDRITIEPDNDKK
jgi:hypothetical protein